jgi:tetratricopeptide (TPR) repeat protein
MVRRYGEAGAVLQKGIDVAPDEPDCYVILAGAVLGSTGDPAKAREVWHRTLERLTPSRFIPNFAPSAEIVAPDAELRRGFLALNIGDFGRDSNSYYYSRAGIYRLAGEPALARAYLDSSRVFLEAKVRQLPDDYGFHGRLGLTYGRLGRFDEAIREGQRAVELLPPSRDAFFGVDNVIGLATIYALAGQAKPAVQNLRAALAVPSRLVISELKTNTDWDRIREDPEFRRLIGT